MEINCTQTAHWKTTVRLACVEIFNAHENMNGSISKRVAAEVLDAIVVATATLLFLLTN